MDSAEQVFYVPGQQWIIDYAAANASGVVVSNQRGMTLEEVQKESPGAIICTFGEAYKAIEDGCKSAPEQITEEQFEFALNCLPPQDWKRGQASESFKMCERLNGNVTRIYVRIDTTYWRLSDVYTMKHAEILEMVTPHWQKLAA